MINIRLCLAPFEVLFLYPLEFHRKIKINTTNLLKN